MAALAVVVALAGCAGVRVPPIGEAGRPFALDPDERELWDAAAREAEAIARAGALRADPALEAHLSAVAERLMPRTARAAGGPAPTVAVLMDPALNAFALPTGRIFVSSGLVARAESEGRLAAILAREVAHVRLRHALAALRGGRPLAAGPAAGAGIGLAGLPLAHLAAVEGFGGRREREADAEALDALTRAGYDAREAPRAFDALHDPIPIDGELPPGDDSRRVERFGLGDPGRCAERARSLRRLLARDPSRAAPAAPGAHTAALASLTLPLVRDNARLDAGAGRPRRARAQLDRVLAAAPGDPVAHLYDGDLLRLQAQRAAPPEGVRALLARARRAYERAAELDPAWPEPYRGLALLAYQAGDPASARAAFERYLSLRPDGPDARRIREYLIELGAR